MSDPDDFSFNCHECGEFDCDIDHDSEDYFEDESDWFDGSGLIGDD